MGVINVTDLTELLTGAAPVSNTEGVPLDFAAGYRVVVSAPTGQTLSGAGTLLCYFWNSFTGWARNPSLDLAIGVSAVQSQAFQDVLTAVPKGRVRYVGNGITTSAGTTVNVHYEVGSRQ